MLFIFLLALILFGPKKLPEIGREIGRFMAEFKRASNNFKYQLQEEMEKAGVDAKPSEPGAQQSSAFKPQSSSFTQTLLPAAVTSAISQIDNAHERLLQTARMAFDAQNYTTPRTETPTAIVPDALPASLSASAETGAPAAQAHEVVASQEASPVVPTTDQPTPDSAPAKSNSAPQSS